MATNQPRPRKIYRKTCYILNTCLSITLKPEYKIKRGVKDPNMSLRAVPTHPCLCLLEFALLNYWPSFAANASVQTNQRGTPRSPVSSARPAHSAITPTLSASCGPSKAD